MAKDAAPAKEKKAHKEPPKQEKVKKPKKEAAPVEVAAVKVEEAPKVVAPRPPADLRLKILKKFHGKFLPKGVLRVRQAEIMARWNSGDDHGGVKVEELKALLDDWRGTQEKPPRLPKA